MFYWVSVDGDHANGGCPFVVLLVNVLVQEWEVNKPKERKERNVGTCSWFFFQTKI